jgi:catechol 2,3-dioxygenase-like lactoylglutathione lyase family enzyme
VARLIGINHVAVQVGDIDEMLEFLGRLVERLELRGRSGRMAFVDLGDQFIALERSSEPAAAGHYGLVVDDQAEVVRRAREAGARMIGGHDFLDPWGNHWQVVDYREVQFTKTERILDAMGFGELEKSDSALAELRQKNLAD